MAVKSEIYFLTYSLRYICFSYSTIEFFQYKVSMQTNVQRVFRRIHVGLSNLVESNDFAKPSSSFYLKKTCSYLEYGVVLKQTKKCFALNFICNACRCRVDYNWLHSNTSEVNAKLDYRWKTLFKFVFLCTRS